MLTYGNPFQSFEGVGIFANQQDEGCCLRIGLCATLFPLLKRALVNAQPPSENGS
jgi:hypothetical protein